MASPAVLLLSGFSKPLARKHPPLVRARLRRLDKEDLLATVGKLLIIALRQGSVYIVRFLYSFGAIILILAS